MIQANGYPIILMVVVMNVKSPVNHSQSQTQTQPQKEVKEQQNKSTLTLEEIDKRLKKIEHTLYGTN